LTLWTPREEVSSRVMLPCRLCWTRNFLNPSWHKYGTSGMSSISNSHILSIPPHRDLVDLNNDGNLTREGFAVALHLINGKLAGKEIPSTLPPSLVPPSMRKPSTAPGAFTPAPAAVPHSEPFFAVTRPSASQLRQYCRSYYT
jgi:hypothetical protein